MRLSTPLPPSPPAAAAAGVRSWATDLTHAVGNRSLILPLVGLVAVAAGQSSIRSGRAVHAAFHRAAWRAQGARAVTDFANYWAHRALHRVRRCGGCTGSTTRPLDSTGWPPPAATRSTTS